jgi:hypothetical protein
MCLSMATQSQLQEHLAFGALGEPKLRRRS